EDVVEMPGDRDLAYRIGQFAVLDPQAGGATAVVAGHEVGAHADQVSDVKAVLDVGDQLSRRLRSRFEMQIGRRRGRGRRDPARRMAGGCKRQFARGRAVEKPRFEHAVIDYDEGFAQYAFAVERAGAKPTLAQRIVDDADA